MPALTCGCSGDLRSVADARQLVADRRRVFGADHPDTLRVRQQLDRWQVTAGDPANTVDTTAHVLEDRSRLLDE